MYVYTACYELSYPPYLLQPFIHIAHNHPGYILCMYWFRNVLQQRALNNIKTQIRPGIVITTWFQHGDPSCWFFKTITRSGLQGESFCANLSLLVIQQYPGILGTTRTIPLTTAVFNTKENGQRRTRTTYPYREKIGKENSYIVGRCIVYECLWEKETPAASAKKKHPVNNCHTRAKQHAY